MHKKNLINTALSILSGILIFLAFPPFKFAVIAWVCLVPLLFVVRRSTRGGSFWYSYLTGAVFFGGLMYWLLNVSIPGTIILILLLSVFFGLFGVVANMIFKYSAEILILPFIWAVLEYIRSYLFTGFPWGLLAYSQYENINLMQVADITGSYGISFLIVMFNVALFAYLVRMERKTSYMMVALFFMLMSTMYGLYRLDNMNVWGSPLVSVVQGNIPQKLKWEARHAKTIIDEYSALTREAKKDKPDLIVWPETAYPYVVGGGAEAKEISTLSEEVDVPILAGVVYEKDYNFFNSAVLFPAKGKPAVKYDKLHLVPFGEYVPLGDKLSFLREYIDKPIGDFKRGDKYTLFPLRSTLSTSTMKGTISRQTSFFRFGVLICFEDIFPELARNFVLEGANLLFNITNDAWFGRTAAPEQHLQASVFRAVENRVPVIRAANTGVSCFVDSTGKILSRVETDGKDIFVSGYATDRVRVLNLRSFYTKYGDAFIYFCGFMLILLFAMEWYFTKSQKVK
jgi:apolipoprotein N-acyltransferase